LANVQPNTLNRVMLLRGRLGMGGSFNQKTYAVAASQAIKKGDLLMKSSGGNTVEQAISAPSTSNSTASGGSKALIGVALEDITTNASGVEAATGKTQISVAVLDANLEIGLRVLSGNLSSLSLGTTYQFARTTPTAGNTFYCLSTSPTGELIYLGPYAGSGTGDTYGVAWCRVVPDKAIAVA
jgi:uncharacterized protein with beta-barrel porin domain